MKPAGAALVGELNEDMAGNIGRGRRESNPTAKSSRAEAAAGKRKRPRGGGLSSSAGWFFRGPRPRAELGGAKPKGNTS
jgi:hypothetical protein